MGAVNLRDGLVAEYLCRGNFQDSAGGTYDGTIYNATLTTDKNGRLNSAYYFDGNDDYVDFGDVLDITAGKPFSISFWTMFPVAALGVQHTLVNNRIDVKETPRCMIQKDAADTLHFYLNNGSSIVNLNSTSTMSADIWYHGCLTRDSSGNVKLYFNGVEEDTGTRNETMETANSVWGVGRQKSTAFIYYNYSVGDIRFWDRELSAEEVKQSYSQIKPHYQPIFEDCIAYYDFNGDAKDLIGGYDGTVSNATLATDRTDIADSCYSFNGSNSKIDVGFNLSSYTDWTIAGWMYVDDAGAGYFIGNNGGVTNGDFGYSITSSRYMSFFIRSGTGFADSVNQLEYDTWYFVALTKSGTTYSHFLNGVAGSSGTNTQNMRNANFRFGESLVSTLELEGDIGESFFWSRALTSDELKHIYNITKSKKITPFSQGGKE